ncbi:MAG: hypothetical protein U9N49_07475 [Campylobacterota bacterium]|nr:hypothetical protein [Campylobacterota bacterium]
MKRNWWMVALLPIFYTSAVASEVKFADIIVQSFIKSDANVYMQKVAPTFEEYFEVRQKIRSHEKLDINRTKDAYSRDYEDIVEDWASVKAKMLRENIDFSKVKFIDSGRQEDRRLAKTLDRDTLRYIFLNFSQGDILFTIKLKECVKFEDWKCGEGMSFKKFEIEDSASSASSANTN